MTGRFALSRRGSTRPPPPLGMPCWCTGGVAVHSSAATRRASVGGCPDGCRFLASCRAGRSLPRGLLRSGWVKAASGAWTSIAPFHGVRMTGTAAPQRSRCGVAPDARADASGRGVQPPHCRDAPRPPAAVVGGSGDRGGGPGRLAWPAVGAWCERPPRGCGDDRSRRPRSPRRLAGRHLAPARRGARAQGARHDRRRARAPSMADSR